MPILSSIKSMLFVLFGFGRSVDKPPMVPAQTDYQSWYKQRAAYEKMQEHLRMVIAECEDEKELLPESKQTIKSLVNKMGNVPKGMIGMPHAQEIYSALFDEAVSRGCVPLMRFLVAECGVNPNAMATIEKPNSLHSLALRKKDYLSGPYKVARELFALGLKPAHVNSWNAEGRTPLHKAVEAMIIAGSNTTLSREQFIAGMAKSGIKFDSADDIEQEYKNFIALSKKRGEEWLAVSKLFMAYGAQNLKDAQGRKVDDLLLEANCKADCCEKFAAYIKRG
jgi:hypothetical protein